MERTTNRLLVIGVSNSGATIAANGENKRIDWATFREAAVQDDQELRKLYASLLDDARRMAREDRDIEVIIGVRHDPSGDSHSYATDCTGQNRWDEFRPADGDGQGTRRECELTVGDMARCARSKGYDVELRPTTLPDGTIAS